MLFGPPGTGKTLLAKATALMMQRNPSEDSVSASVRGGGGYFISLSASDIVRSEVGKSEKLVSSAFKTARENAPSVIFIDEFQALFTSRDGTLGGGGKGSSRLASTLLQCMDDIVKWQEADSSVLNRNRKTEFENNRVVVLGATNTPWMIDRAFLRAGRFDRVSQPLASVHQILTILALTYMLHVINLGCACRPPR
jgi:SpoVK/Ycf46/Vps4 family AAA+-type ATPase